MGEVNICTLHEDIAVVLVRHDDRLRVHDQPHPAPRHIITQARPFAEARWQIWGCILKQDSRQVGSSRHANSVLHEFPNAILNAHAWLPAGQSPVSVFGAPCMVERRGSWRPPSHMQRNTSRCCGSSAGRPRKSQVARRLLTWMSEL